MKVTYRPLCLFWIAPNHWEWGFHDSFFNVQFLFYKKEFSTSVYSLQKLGIAFPVREPGQSLLQDMLQDRRPKTLPALFGHISVIQVPGMAFLPYSWIII